MPETNRGRKPFTEFPSPLHQDDAQLVTAGADGYVCTGCGGDVPGGMLVHPDVVARGTRKGSEELVVVGVYARAGTDGWVTHACGTLAGKFREINGPLDETEKQQRARNRDAAVRAARREGES